MKKLLSVTLALLLVLCCFSAFAAAIPDELPTGTLTAAAKLYKKASTKNGTVATLKKGAEVEIIGETTSFYRVVSENKAGYLLKKYLKTGSGESASSSGQTEKPASSSKNPLGSRKNPAKIGDTVTYDVSSWLYGSGRLELTLTNVIRGSAAYQQLLQWNMFNDAPKAGYEYALLYFTAKLTKDTSDNDKGFEINYAQFDHADKSYAVDSTFAFGVVEPKLDARLYEGSTTTGYVLMECIPGETSYAVYYDDVWFRF